MPRTRDLKSIKKYYPKDGASHIGKQFTAAFIEHIQLLLDNLEIGRVVPEFGGERIMKFIHSPFRIVYLREQDSIHVIRV